MVIYFRQGVEHFADHGSSRGLLPSSGGDTQATLGSFATAGVDVKALANQLQDEGARSFVKSWNELMGVIASKSESLKKAG